MTIISKDQLFEMLRSVSFRQSQLGDTVLRISRNDMVAAYDLSVRLSEIILYADMLEDAYLRMEDQVPLLTSDDELRSTYNLALNLTTY